MKTKKNIEKLLKEGLHFSLISNLTPNQIKVLVEKLEAKEVVQTTPSSGFKTTAQAGDEVPIGPDTLVIAKGPVEIMSKEKPGTSPKTEGEMTEKFESKAQQGFFWAKCNTSKGVKKKKWCELAKEFSDSTSKKQYKKMPEKKHPEKKVKRTDENYERYLEDKIVEMVDKKINPAMTKSQLVNSVNKKVESSESFMLKNPKKNTMFQEKEMKENTKEKERTREKDRTKEKDRKKDNPFRDPNPGVEEQPKANTKEKERTREKDRTKEKDRKKDNPFKDPNPGVQEEPKAEDQKNDFMSAITSILRN